MLLASEGESAHKIGTHHVNIIWSEILTFERKNLNILRRPREFRVEVAHYFPEPNVYKFFSFSTCVRVPLGHDLRVNKFSLVARVHTHILG